MPLQYYLHSVLRNAFSKEKKNYIKAINAYTDNKVFIPVIKEWLKLLWMPILNRQPGKGKIFFRAGKKKKQLVRKILERSKPVHILSVWEFWMTEIESLMANCLREADTKSYRFHSVLQWDLLKAKIYQL